jgi:tRNA(fMet)-specific endonuclease VapC
MNKTLLDTDIFSEVLRGRNSNVIRNAEAYRAQFGRYTLSVVTIMEIVKGLQQAGRTDRIELTLQAIKSEEILSLDARTAELAGRIYGDLNRTGQPIGRADPMIAAVASLHGLVLITGNVRHFERIPKLGYPLELADWRE